MYSLHCELGLGYMTVPEMLETMHKNDLFDMFLVFSNVVHILGVLPATFCSTEQSFSETYLCSTTERQRVSNFPFINIERAYANSVVNNAMNCIIDIFSHKNGKGSYFF